MSEKNGKKVKDTHRSNIRRVEDHYELWPFPGTDFFSREGLLLMRYLGKWLREDKSCQSKESSVIDVGCGTGHTTVALARGFPDASFLGIEISEKSIREARLQSELEGLTNITFRKKDLREDLSDLGQFKVVLSLGVLHHISDFEGTFRNIVRLVEPGGYLVLWLYGIYGRFRHTVNQEFLRLMTKDLSEPEALDIVKAFLEDLGPRFAAGSGYYTPKGSGEDGLAWMLARPQWLADQMIPAYERGVTLADILRSFKANKMEFRKWFGVPIQLEDYASSEALVACFQRLSPREKLMAIDTLIKPEYYFVVGKKRN